MPGYQQTKRFTGLPLIPAATDIAGFAPVQIVPAGSTAEWSVLPCQKVGDPILGVTRASAPATYGVTVYDMPDIKQAVAAASIGIGQFIGVVSANAVTGSGTSKILIPQIAKVQASSGSANYALGIALEGAAVGSTFSYYFKPTQLSGLS